MINIPANSSFHLLIAAGLSLALGACGRSPAPDTVPATPSTAAAAADAAEAESARAADLAAREQELAAREAAVKQQELQQELARRDAETAAAVAAEQAAAADEKAKAAAAAKKKAAAAAATAASPKPAAKPPAPIIVPAGTQLAVELTTPVSTKTAKVGDSVQGRLQSDLMVGDRRAASAGAPVQGSVTQVVSGSNKIGGVPTLALTFNSLAAVNGMTVPISGQLVQQGTSETAKDTAKILGGAAVGAIIGHQVNHKNGSVVGGILGGAAGTAAAKTTGGEVTLPAGTVIAVTTQASFQIDR